MTLRMSEHEAQHKSLIGSICTLIIVMISVLYACDTFIIQSKEKHRRFGEQLISNDTVSFGAKDGFTIAIALTKYDDGENL